MDNKSIEWMKEKLPYLKKGNWIYKIICFLCGRSKTKLSYKEIYLILYEINRKKLGDEKAKKLSLLKVLSFYKDINNKYPQI